MLLRKLSSEWTVALLASLGLHGLWLASEAQASRPQSVEASEVLLEAYEAPPAPPAPEPPPAAEEEPAPEPAAAPTAVAQAAERPATDPRPATAPPPAAQAGQTLTAPDDGQAPGLVDFTLVQGTGTAYVGGTTSALGTSQKAVRGAARDGESRLPVGPALAATPVYSGPDRSASPKPEQGNWDCSRLFPKDPSAGDFAQVSIVVTVSPAGKAQRVSVLQDPGHGFGAAARACALGQRFTPGRDRAGSLITATTPPIRVRFTR